MENTETTPEYTDDQPIVFTEAAIEAALNAIEQEGSPGDGLRVAVKGGGCSGLKYSLDFEKEPRMTDLTLEFGALKVYLDPASVTHLKGTRIDFLSGINEQGFKFENPNAVRTCGCGHSFN